jgi:hypothetical protein
MFGPSPIPTPQVLLVSAPQLTAQRIKCVELSKAAKRSYGSQWKDERNKEGITDVSKLFMTFTKNLPQLRTLLSCVTQMTTMLASYWPRAGKFH